MQTMLTPEQRNETLRRLAENITRMGIRMPVSIILDVFGPFDVLSSQFAIMARPFVTGYRWEHYARALTDETSWQELRRLLSRQH
ncbi:MAG: hypothetical protein MI924_34535 [Chloroflexales bacterium]|nr:hypothetical protein [Chloroflexales bacterium]